MMNINQIALDLANHLLDIETKSKTRKNKRSPSEVDKFIKSTQWLSKRILFNYATSATIALTTDIELGDGDNNKIAYHLPAMGGFTAGVSFTDSGEVGSTDTTTYGMNYVMEAAGNTVTIGAATATTEATTKDTDCQILGVKVDSGNLSFIASQTSYEAVDEDISTTGVGVSYKLPKGVILAAYTLKSEDDLDVGEEYSKSGVEVQYIIASGLTAYLNVEDYDYKIGTNNDSGDIVANSGTVSKLKIAASF
jgi:hypothetical protein